MLTQFLGEVKQPCGSKHQFGLTDIHIKANSRNSQYLTQFVCVKAQLLPIYFTCHHPIGDLTVGIEFSQIRYRTSQLGVYKQVQPTLGSEFLQEHLQALFLKIRNLHNFAPHHPLLKKLGQFWSGGCCLSCFPSAGLVRFTLNRVLFGRNLPLRNSLFERCFLDW